MNYLLNRASKHRDGGGGSLLPSFNHGASMSLEEQHRVGKENYTLRRLAERRAQESDGIARPASESLTVMETSDMLTESLNNLDSLVMELHQAVFPDYGGEDCMEVQSYPKNVIARRQIEMNNGVRATREKVEEILDSLR